MTETIVMNLNPVKLEEIEIDETEENPWSVEDVSVFLNYCCPECDYKNQDLNVFSEHALHNHFNATALFGVENYDDKLLFDFNKTEFDEDNKDDLFEQMQTDDIDISNTFVYHLISKKCPEVTYFFGFKKNTMKLSTFSTYLEYQSIYTVQ